MRPGVERVVPAVWKFEVRQDRFLRLEELRRVSPFAVLGPKFERELLGEESSLGECVKISGRRFVVVGVIARRVRSLVSTWTTRPPSTCRARRLFVKAIGATPRQIARLFLLEAAPLSLAGGLGGVAAEMAVGAAIRLAVQALVFRTASGFVAAALLVSLAVELGGGVLSARRAAWIDPLESLRCE